MKTATEKQVTAEPAVLYQTENDLPKNTRVELVALINQRLADAIDLQAQLKQAHWNAKGPHFIGLHELFDKIAEEDGVLRGHNRRARRATGRHCRGHGARRGLPLKA